MSFSVYRDEDRSRLVGHFLTLDEALVQLSQHNLLVLPADTVLTAPVVIPYHRVTVDVGVPGTHIHFGEDARVGTVTGAAAVITSSAPIARIYAPDTTLEYRGGVGRDIITSGTGADMLFGGAGADLLYGGANDDLLVGGDDRDELFGGDGVDTLLAGAGRDFLTGGADADAFHLTLVAGETDRIMDFNAVEGDSLHLAGPDAPADWAAFLAAARIVERTDDTVIKIGDASIQLIGATAADITEESVRFTPSDALTFDTAAEFLAAGVATEIDLVRIGAATYRLRDADPMHEDFKFQDDAGRWWSPDYFVLAAAGQSNMLGVGDGGDMTLSGNVNAWDHVNGALVDADYTAAPAAGPGVRSGSAIKNNLFFPLAERISAELERPVMVVAHPISGSRLETWLEDQEGSNWAALSDDIAAGLAAIGQTRIDSFVWHQGEADTRMETADYAADFLSLVAQVRAVDWGGDVPFIAGELSRAGANAAQNAALQLVEMANTDAALRFASSVGLTSAESTGVHFDGASLVEFGAERFWDALSDALSGAPIHSGNTAPTIDSETPPLASFTITEGEIVDLDIASWFTDAEGDALYSYGFLDQRGVQILDAASDGSILTLMPDFAAAGDYTLSVYVSDGEFDSAAIDIALTVLDATSTVRSYSGADFVTPMADFADAASAMAALSANRGLDILDQSALGTDLLVTTESLTFRGGAEISGTLVLADGLLRLYTAGEAAFDLTGNDGNNTLNGSEADNVILGLGGSDRIDGGAGADVIDGGAGTDYVWGGAGADRFAFNSDSEHLQLRDFASGEDIIEISGFAGVDDFDSMMAAAVVRISQGRTILDIGDDRLVLSAMTPDALIADDFAFL